MPPVFRGPRRGSTVDTFFTLHISDQGDETSSSETPHSISKIAPKKIRRKSSISDKGGLRDPKIIAQLQCALLQRLPAEIRCMIWELAIGGRSMHIRGKLGPDIYNCISPNEQICRAFSRCSQGVPNRNGLLQLPLTCRQIYSEAIPILYSTSTFSFARRYNSPGQFLDFHSKIPPRSFSSIRHIDLVWKFARRIRIVREGAVELLSRDEDLWERVWGVLASRPNLQSLRVVLVLHPRGQPLADFTAAEEEILAPLTKVKVAGVWELYVPWEPKRDGKMRGKLTCTKIGRTGRE